MNIGPFDPLFRNPHLQTIAGHFWRRHGEESRFPVQPRLYRTEPEVEVLVQSQRPDGRTAGEVVMVHGLEGSGEAGYVRSLGGAALRAGFAAHRFHMRTCGGTERRCGTLYHAQRDNLLYERRFVQRMRTRLRATGRYRKSELAGLRSVTQIDDRITAPSFGFGTAERYYSTQSAVRYLEGIRVPALLIHAQDDTLVPFGSVRTHAVRANSLIELLDCEYGGHLGFIGRRPHRFWADYAIMEWITRRARVA